MSRYVTRTGRVNAPGIVTRASHRIRTRAKGQIEKPLPIHLQCHPKALTPTSHNPGCITRKYVYACQGWDMANQFTVNQLKRGKGLSEIGRYELSGLTCKKRFTDDPQYAMAYKTAARITAGLDLEVLTS